MNEFLQQTINGLAWGSIYALIALGYTMVYGILRLINFAHGDVYMIGAMVGCLLSQWLLTWMGAAAMSSSLIVFPFVLASSMMVCALLGFLIERIAYRPLRQAPRINSLITAIGVSLLLQFGGQMLFGADPRFFPPLISEKPIFAGTGLIINRAQILILSTTFVLMVSLHLFVTKTKWGLALRAVSHSHVASQLMGFPLNRVITLTFMLGSALAGAGGVLVGLSNPKVDALMGIMPGLKAFVAAVLGGIGSIPGACLGGLLMGVLETYVTAYISSTYRDALAFVLLILILLFRSQGLLGRKKVEKV